jgi:hypothetical protein
MTPYVEITNKEEKPKTNNELATETITNIFNSNLQNK